MTVDREYTHELNSQGSKLRVSACGEIVVCAIELGVGRFFQVLHDVQVIVQRVKGSLTNVRRGYVYMHVTCICIRVHIFY